MHEAPTTTPVVHLKRRRGSRSEAHRRRVEAQAGHEGSDILAAWTDTVQDDVSAAQLDMPAGFEDPDSDLWESLLTVADAVGEDWPARARIAAVALVAESKESTPSPGIRLLAGLRQVSGGRDGISTVAILSVPQGIEEGPWS